MLSRFVTTSRTRIINPRYVVPCTLYLLVITAPSLSLLLSRSTTSSSSSVDGVAARGVAARGREHTYDFFSPPISVQSALAPSFSRPWSLKEKCSLHATDLAGSPLEERRALLPCAPRPHTQRLNARVDKFANRTLISVDAA